MPQLCFCTAAQKLWGSFLWGSPCDKNTLLRLTPLPATWFPVLSPIDPGLRPSKYLWNSLEQSFQHAGWGSVLTEPHCHPCSSQACWGHKWAKGRDRWGTLIVSLHPWGTFAVDSKHRWHNGAQLPFCCQWGHFPRSQQIPRLRRTSPCDGAGPLCPPSLVTTPPVASLFHLLRHSLLP